MEGTYRHFTLEERRTLFRLLGAKLPIKEIAGEDGRLCHETIYQFVYSPEGRALELHRHLLRARRLRRRRFGRKARSLKIPPEQTIAQRPAEIGERQMIGHWEADLLIFQRVHGNANLTSLVERRSRLVRLIPNHDRRSARVIGAIGEMLAELPAMVRQTITFDRGSEFLGYQQLAKGCGIDSYSYGSEPRQASTACCLHRGLP